MHHAAGAKGEQDRQIANEGDVPQNFPFQGGPFEHPVPVVKVLRQANPGIRVLHHFGERIAADVVSEKKRRPDQHGRPRRLKDGTGPVAKKKPRRVHHNENDWTKSRISLPIVASAQGPVGSLFMA
jgi:hypothetical protein